MVCDADEKGSLLWWWARRCFAFFFSFFDIRETFVMRRTRGIGGPERRRTSGLGPS
jgi:hypothetical protein